MDTGLEIHSSDDWRRSLRRWVDAGIVTPDQAVRIIELEAADAAPVGTPSAVDGHSQRVVTPVIELVSYFGIVLVSVSGFVFVGRFWTGLALVGHLVVGLGVAAVGLVGGTLVHRIDDAGARRLSGVFWLGGTAGVAMAVGVVANQWGHDHYGLTLLLVGVAVLALSVGLWRNDERPLQFISALAGLVTAAIGFAVVTNLPTTLLERDLLFWSVGIALGLAGLHLLRPTSTVLVVAELVTIYGAISTSFSSHVLGVVLGLVTTTGATGVGLWLKRPPVVVVGVIGYFFIVIRAFAIYLRGTGAILGSLLMGILLVGASIWRATRVGRTPRAPDPGSRGGGDARGVVERH